MSKARTKPKPAPAATPALTLVPSSGEPAEQHAPSSEERCGATASFSGERFTCTLEARHGGIHQCAGRYWRPRSGDAQ